MKKPSAITLSTPHLIAVPDIYAVIQAALKVVIRSWIGICRERLLTPQHRSNEPRTAGLLYHRMKAVERERDPRKPPMKIKCEVGTFSAGELEIPDGRIDIEIIYSLSDDPDLRLECKRVSTSAGDASARPDSS